MHDEIGYNYRLTNLAAALGVAQLEQLPGFLARKLSHAAAYDAALADLPGLTPPPRRAWAEPSLWLYSILIDPQQAGIDRDGLAAALAAQGIEARSLWCPAHVMEPYRGLPRLCGSVAEDLFARGLSLPSSVGLTDGERQRVIEALRGALPAAR